MNDMLSLRVVAACGISPRGVWFLSSLILFTQSIMHQLWIYNGHILENRIRIVSAFSLTQECYFFLPFYHKNQGTAIVSRLSSPLGLCLVKAVPLVTLCLTEASIFVEILCIANFRTSNIFFPFFAKYLSRWSMALRFFHIRQFA